MSGVLPGEYQPGVLFHSGKLNRSFLGFPPCKEKSPPELTGALRFRQSGSGLVIFLITVLVSLFFIFDLPAVTGGRFLHSHGENRFPEDLLTHGPTWMSLLTTAGDR